MNLAFKNILFLLVIALCTTTLRAQVIPIDYDERGLHTVDRLNILYPSDSNYHTAIRYQNVEQVLDYSNHLNYSAQDNHDLMHLSGNYTFENPRIDSSSSGFFGSIYTSPYHFLSVDKKNFNLTIDPIILFSVGKDFENDETIFQNTRGLKVKGSIDQKVYFYTSIYENQRRFLSHIEGRISRFDAIPGQGFYKPYQSSVFDNLNGWDYLNAQAYFGLNVSKSIELQFGHGNNFIGHGIRSMILSDYGHNYLFLKFNTKVWRFHYQNIFAELSPIGSKDNIGNQLLPKKYMAAHYLSFKFSSRFSIGLYESVIFSRPDHFEFQYLNPVILYRTAEQFLDSPDNVLLGINTQWTPINQIQLYGQLLIDELRSDQIFTGNGWWGNKVGYQIGAKYYNAFDFDHLDIQLEYNSARPYTYSHRKDPVSTLVSGSYSHYNQPLAHPLGANFREIVATGRYQINSRWFFNLTYVHTSYGDDLNQNIGNDILQPYEDRTNDFGNFTGQGQETSVSLLSLKGSWQFFTNYYVDLEFINRRQNSEEALLNYQSQYLGFSIRANMFNQKLDY